MGTESQILESLLEGFFPRPVIPCWEWRQPPYKLKLEALMAGGCSMLSGLELCTGRALIQCDSSTHCNNENKVRLLSGTARRCQPTSVHHF